MVVVEKCRKRNIRRTELLLDAKFGDVGLAAGYTVLEGIVNVDFVFVGDLDTFTILITVIGAPATVVVATLTA